MSLYGYVTPLSNSPTVTIKQYETPCEKYKNEPYECIDCEKQCLNGKQAVKTLEKETRKPMSARQLRAADSKINAMTSYIEAMKAPDPIAFIMEKYKCNNVRMAKNKLYQWQHNYGTNLVKVKEDLTEIQAESDAYKAQKEKELTNAQEPVIPPKTKTSVPAEKPAEEKKMTRRQEEKISQSHLELMRSELEKEFLQKEKEIEEHKQAIVDCEHRIEEITNQIQALRQVLDIFNAKNALYV